MSFGIHVRRRGTPRKTMPHTATRIWGPGTAREPDAPGIHVKGVEARVKLKSNFKAMAKLAEVGNVEGVYERYTGAKSNDYFIDWNRSVNDGCGE